MLTYYDLSREDERLNEYFTPVFEITMARFEAIGGDVMGLGSARDRYTAAIIATAEAAERRAFSQAGNTTLGRLDEKSHRVDPATIYRLSDAQRSHMFLDPYNKTGPHLWVQAYNVFEDCVCELPVELCHVVDLAEEYERCGDGNTSGMAAHHDLFLAQRAALLELFERDALMCHWMSKVAPHKIPDRLLPELAATMKENMGGLEYSFFTMDLTCRDIPVIMTLAYRNKWPAMVVGMGAAFSYEEAIDKAWRELELNLYWRLRNTVRHRYNGNDCLPVNEVRSVAQHELFYNHPLNSGNASWLWSETEEVDTLPCVNLGHVSDAEDIKACAKLLGIDTLYQVEYVRTWGFNVVRLITPGLVPLLFGYNQFPLDHAARETCSLIGTPCTQWKSVIPPHPLD